MREIADIDVLGDAALQQRIARLSLVVAAATVLLAVLLCVGLDGEGIDVWWWVALAAGSLLALPAHELVHAAAFKLLCPGCRVGFGFQDAFLYTRTDGAVAGRGRMVVVLAAPAVLVSAALAAAALAAARPVLALLLVGILRLANGKVAHHRGERRRQRAGIRARPAAARRGLGGSELLKEFSVEVHRVPLPK